MGKPKFQRHPLTGEPIEPIGYRADGRAIWPIMGGDENTDPDPLDDPDNDPDDADNFLTLSNGRTVDQAAYSKHIGRARTQGTKDLIRSLGFEPVLNADGTFNLDESTKAIRDAIAPKPKAPAAPAAGADPAADASTDATKRAETAEAEARRVQAEANAKVRRADLRSTLAELGCPRGDDLDDAHALLDRALGADYDADDLEEAADKLRARRPDLFKGTAAPQQPANRGGQLPAGGQGRKPAPTPAVFGAAGKARAERMFGKKS